MILRPALELKSPMDAKPGELIALELRAHRALGLVLAVDPNQTLVGLLRSDEPDLAPSPPFAFNLDRRYNSNKQCLSYGHDWVLELTSGAESIPGNKRAYASPGVVYVDDGQVSIYFPSMETRGFTSGYTFDLLTSQLVESTDKGIPHLSWHIWASEAERDHFRASPIFSFSGQIGER